MIYKIYVCEHSKNTILFIKKKCKYYNNGPYSICAAEHSLKTVPTIVSYYYYYSYSVHRPHMCGYAT